MVDVVVHLPPGRDDARAYILDTVLGDFLGITYALERGAPGLVRVSATGAADERTLSWPDRFLGMDESGWLKPIPSSSAAQAVPQPQGFETTVPGRIPVIFGECRPEQAIIETRTDGWWLNQDVLGTAFWFLTRYEEHMDPLPPDIHGRFPVSRSVSTAMGTVREPVVDTLVDLLGVILDRLWPGIVARRPARAQVHLTHDVDRPYAIRGRSSMAKVRHIVGDVVLRRSPTTARRNAVAALGAALGATIPDSFVVWDFIMKTSERHGLRSLFYLKGGASHARYDEPYSLDDPSMRALLREIVDRGHAIGVHGSYLSAEQPSRLGREIEVVRSAASAAGQRSGGIGFRQHYLRWTPQTWAQLEDAGVAHDSSLGWPGGIGFRSGTCRPYRTFGLRSGRAHRVVERPLLVMDVSILRAIDRRPDAAFDATMTMLERCRRPGGSMVLLWHNSSLDTPHRRAWYSELVRAVA